MAQIDGFYLTMDDLVLVAAVARHAQEFEENPELDVWFVIAENLCDQNQGWEQIVQRVQIRF